MYYKMRRAGKTLERIGAVDFATTVAPGLRDVLLTGKVFEAVRRRDERRVRVRRRGASTRRRPVGSPGSSA